MTDDPVSGEELRSGTPNIDPTFDPPAWDRASAGDTWVFTRSVDLGLAAVLRLAPPGATVLDAGCGPGRLARSLASAGCRVIGLDTDPAMLAHATPGYSGSSAEARPHFVRGSAEQLPLRTASVGAVVATSLFGCLAAPERFLAEANRVLAPGGVLIVTITNRRSLLLRLNYGLLNRRGGAPAHGGPERFRLHTAREAEILFRSAGFQVETPACYNFVLQVGRRLWPGKSLALRLDRIAGGRGGIWARNFLLIGWKL